MRKKVNKLQENKTPCAPELIVSTIERLDKQQYIVNSNLLFVCLVSSIEYTSLRIASPDKLIQSILQSLNVFKVISFRISETSAGLQTGAFETCKANKHLGQWQAGG